MSPSGVASRLVPLVLCVLLACTVAKGDHRLSFSYYDKTCPSAQHIVQSVMASRVAADQPTAPAVLRLFFHDCFVNGCDGSVLLDSTPSMDSEKDAEPNDSLRGFDVIDDIKAHLEHACPGTVSCADVLALASRDAVVLLGGPAWNVELGRKDSRGADKDAAETKLPSPKENLTVLIDLFAEHGLDARDMAALSGAHTVGTARCRHYKDRVYGSEGGADIIDPAFAVERRRTCQAGGDDAMAPFDEQTPMRFDNAYYKDLVARRGLLTSDQELYGRGGPLDQLVEMYSNDGEAFARDFAKAMVKMGRIPPPLGMPVEVRLSCHMVNNY
ncbi:unnamed protein product [Urochloa decumbens]|uniref:Peroxidase n=1 Tax=Urochloa decumbens TaxID=240449 RepID=A0ABC9H0R5_9POAL